MATQSIADLNLDDEATDEQITPTGGSKAITAYAGEATPDVQGEITAADLRLPRINLGQKSGDLGDQFGNGAIILAKELSLAEYDQFLTDVTVAKIKKYYQHKKKFDPTQPPGQRFDTAQQVLDAGMSLNREDEGIFCERAVDMLLVIPQPEGLDEDDAANYFYHTFEGKKYAAALYTAASSQFTEAGKTVLTASQKPDCMKPHSIRRAKWDIKTLQKTGPMGKWWVLKFVRNGNNSEAFVEFTNRIAA